MRSPLWPPATRCALCTPPRVAQVQLIETFDRGVGLGADAPCMIHPNGDVAFTYGEMFDLSHRIAASLKEIGVEQETKVGVLSPNDPIAFACILGALRLNASWVPLNVRGTHEDLEHVLELSDCEVLFFHPTLEEQARALADAVPGVRELVPIADLDTWMAPEGTRVESPADAPEAVAIMFGSGGTTGKSKAVMLTHRVAEPHEPRVRRPHARGLPAGEPDGRADDPRGRPDLLPGLRRRRNDRRARRRQPRRDARLDREQQGLADVPAADGDLLAARPPDGPWPRLQLTPPLHLRRRPDVGGEAQGGDRRLRPGHDPDVRSGGGADDLHLLRARRPQALP